METQLKSLRSRQVSLLERRSERDYECDIAAARTHLSEIIPRPYEPAVSRSFMRKSILQTIIMIIIIIHEN